MKITWTHLLASAVIALASAGPASAVPFLYAGSAATDVDQVAGTTHTIVIGDHGSILDINVSVLLGGAPQWADLDITLSKGATTISLISESLVPLCCSGSAAFDATFDDEAVDTVASVGLSDLVGLFKPEVGSLSAFDGLDIFGTWTLTITEVFGLTDETDLDAWSISGEVDASAIPEPTTLALTGLALAGLGAVRRRRTV